MSLLPVASTSTSNSSSTSNRRTVLFAPNTAWPSSSAFFTSCRIRLLRTYGVPMHNHHARSLRLVAGCQKRKSQQCKFKVVAVKQEGVWVLSADECSWLHSHDGADACEVEEEDEAGDLAGLAAAGQKRRAASASGSESSEGYETSSEESSTDEEGVEYDDAESDGAGGLSTSRTFATFSQLPCPGMPQPGDRFASFNAAYTAAVQALVPVYGYAVQRYSVQDSGGYLRCNHNYNQQSGRCPFQLAVRLDSSSGEFFVSTDDSYLEHNHDPRPEILDDPSWLPTVVNEDARRALGLPPGKRAREKERKGREVKKLKTKKKEEVKQPKRTPSTAAEDPHALRTPSSSAVHSSSSNHSAPFFPPVSGPSSITPFSSLPHGPPIHSDHNYLGLSNAGHLKAASTLQPSSSPSFPQFPSTKPLPPPSSCFFPPAAHLTAFLTSLHPSLASLAPNFLAAGFSSLGSLTSLTLLEPESIEAVVELLRTTSEDERTRPPGGARIGVVQAGLLTKGLREAGSVAVAK